MICPPKITHAHNVFEVGKLCRTQADILNPCSIGHFSCSFADHQKYKQILYVKFWRRYVGRKRVNLYLIGLKATIHAFNKSGSHLEFPMNDVIRGKIIHVAKMATKDESSVDVDFAVCSYKKECFYFISRGIFSLYNVFMGMLS